MRSLLLSHRDLDFLLYDWLDVESLTARPRFADHSRTTFDAVLDLSEQVAAEHFAPHNRAADLDEPRFDGERVHMIPEVGEALRVYGEAGFVGAAMDESVGGMQLPQTVAQACSLWFLAANIGTAAYPFLTVAGANLLIAHGSISAGDHEMGENIVHLVLAKIAGAPQGVKGISLFVVPRFLVGADGSRGERNDVALAGVNHKMGYHGTVNTLLNFGEGRTRPAGSPGPWGTWWASRTTASPTCST